LYIFQVLSVLAIDRLDTPEETVIMPDIMLIRMEPAGISDLVFTERRNLYTVSGDPGNRVYGERLLGIKGKEYREWNPRRSKLSAYIMCGGKSFPFRSDSRVLYLGAASGTTASHVSDIVSDGKVYCVEFAPRSFRDLIKVADTRDNMIPILGDATRPDDYSFAVDDVDIVYEDVAQKRQADILVDNMERYGARYGMVSVKARSEDVTADPGDIFRTAIARLRERGCRILDSVILEPYEKDHMMIAVEKLRTAYAVVFSGDRFLMVCNTRRGGWEMPGGKIESGETSSEAARRECMEESGYDADMIAVRNIGYCDVCAGILKEKVSDAEMDSDLFDELPDELAFSKDEYLSVIPWARDAVIKYRK